MPCCESPFLFKTLSWPRPQESPSKRTGPLPAPLSQSPHKAQTRPRSVGPGGQVCPGGTKPQGWHLPSNYLVPRIPERPFLRLCSVSWMVSLLFYRPQSEAWMKLCPHHTPSADFTHPPWLLLCGLSPLLSTTWAEPWTRSKIKQYLSFPVWLFGPSMLTICVTFT